MRTHGPPRGRPRDDELTDRLLAAAADVVDRQGVAALSVARLVTRTGAGKAAVYRRWRSMDALAADLLAARVLVPVPAETGSLRGDLRALLAPWTTELSRVDRVAAALLSSGRTCPAIQRSLESCLLEPMDDAVATVLGRHLPDPATRTPWTATVVRGLWWDRYLSAAPPLTPRQLDDLVDHVLVPVTPGAAVIPDRSARLSDTSGIDMGHT